MISKEAVKPNKIKSVSYSKWGYIFIAPFFIVFIVFQLIPLVSTFYNSFFESYRVGLTQIGPNFVGLDNYKQLLSNGEVLKYAANTMIIWIIGFIPQIAIAMLLACWFTSLRLKLKAQGFFKTVVYMPNLIMASAFAMLFYTIFADAGPVNNLLLMLGITNEPIRFFANVWATRGLIATMNFLIWFGYTSIMLMAAIMGIDDSLVESAMIDGATSFQIFTKITLPLIKPILTYVMITSLIGGIQMFDVPQILTDGNGAPDRMSMTLIMYLNKHLYSKNVGMAGAVSVVLFIITAILSFIIYKSLNTDNLIRGGKKDVKKNTE